MKFNNTFYDRLKFLTIIVMPAFTALYLGLGQVWDWPNTDKVGTSLGIITVFFGACLQISTKQYNKNDPDVIGHIQVTGANEDTGNPDLKQVFHGLPHELMAGKKKVKFTVGHINMPAKPQDSEPEEH